MNELQYFLKYLRCAIIFTHCIKGMGEGWLVGKAGGRQTIMI